MGAMKITLAVAIVLVSSSPAFSHFVKAALGFRLGYSPTEQQGHAGQKGYAALASTNKAVGVQMLSGVNNGGWKPGTGFETAGSGYGVVGGRSIGGGGPLSAHSGHSAVKHLKILGLNLYLGGRAAAQGLAHAYKPPLIKKPIYNLVQHHHQQYQQQHHPNYLQALAKPVSLGASVGTLAKPVHGHGPNGGKIIGGQSGFRAAVGTPGFGLGFNLGYKQGINTKSPLGHLFGLGGHHGGGGHKYYSPIQKGPIYKGQDQVYIPGAGLLKGHGHDASHSSGYAGTNTLYGAFPQGFETSSIISGLESKQHLSAQPITAASSNAQPQTLQQLQQVQQQQLQQLHQQQSQQQQQLQQQLHHQQQQQGQASHHKPQQAHSPHPKHQGLQGPLSYPAYPRNPFLALFQGRPSILRPTPYQYNFNSPQSLASGPVRMVLSPHPPTPAPQRPHAAMHNEVQGWSTLFPMGASQTPAPNFINPIPQNGQPLAKFHSTLRPGNPFHRHSPVSSAQNHVPFVQQHRPQFSQFQQPQFQGFFSPSPQGIQSQGQGHFSQQLNSPQNNFQQFFGSGFQQQQASGAPQITQEFNPFQSSTQGFTQANFQQQGPIISQSPFFSQIQEQPVQAATPNAIQANKPENNFPGLPFGADPMPFAAEPGFQYSHSTVSDPVKMGDFTINMDMTNSNNNNQGGAEPSSAGSNQPMFGPLGRKLKKTKKARQQDSTTTIVKKQGTAENASKHHDIMETSASNHINSITLASSLGATSWTPIIPDTPKLEKKSLDTKKSVSTSIKVVDKKYKSTQPPMTVTGSGFFSGPINSSTFGGSGRSMVFKKRRGYTSAELASTKVPAMTSSSVVPSSSTSTFPASPSTFPASSSSTTSAYTTTTSTTTPSPSTLSSSSFSPSSSSPEASSSSTTAAAAQTITTSVTSSTAAVVKV